MEIGTFYVHLTAQTLEMDDALWFSLDFGINLLAWVNVGFVLKVLVKLFV